MRILFILPILLFWAGQSAAQDKKQEKELFKEYFLDAEEYFYLEDYGEAIFYYSELLKIDPGNYNLNFLIGACYLSSYGMKEQAIPYLEEAVRGVTTAYRDGSYKESDAPREAWFAMARAYQVDGQLKKAVSYYERYRNAMIKSSFADIEYVNKQIASCQNARRMMARPVEVEFTSLGEKTSQSGATYNAVISGSGRRLVYMNDRPFYRAILMTERKPGGWTPPKVINGELWSEGFAFPTSLSYDGNELYLARKKGNEGDLYVSHYGEGGWSPMKPLNDLNTDYYESHAGISPDGRKLYITSDRPGGEGGLDIWVSQREEGDIWGEPENLGPIVNSFYNEETPFVTSDNKSLFFSSQGHTTMGGYDVFYSDRLPDATWSIPQNIGYPVNTTDDDLFYQPRIDKYHGLYSLIIPDKDPTRNIYAVSLPQEDKDIRIGVRTDTARNERKDSLLAAGLMNEAEENPAGSGDRPADTAATAAATTTGKGVQEDTGMQGVTEKSGETGEASKPDAGGRSRLPEGEVSGPGADINPEEEYYVLNSIFFGFDSYTLNDSALEDVDRLYEVLSKYPDLRLEVTGHTDAVGDADYNQRLSEKRADAVVDYLVNKGIDRNRLISRGVGESAPVAIDYLGNGTDSPEGRRLNRHVSLRLHNLDHPNIEVADVFVPDRLRPKKDYEYSVLLLQSDSFVDTLPDAVNGEDVQLVFADEHYLYTAGNFNNRFDAVRLLNFAIDSGFPDAQMMEKRQLEQMIEDLIGGQAPEAISFTIQVMALKNPVDVGYFSDLGKVTRFKGSDGLTRYVYGEFNEIGNAFSELKKVRQKGYSDAFIMYLAKYKKTDRP